MNLFLTILFAFLISVLGVFILINDNSLENRDLTDFEGFVGSIFIIGIIICLVFMIGSSINFISESWTSISDIITEQEQVFENYINDTVEQKINSVDNYTFDSRNVRYCQSSSYNGLCIVDDDLNFIIPYSYLK